MNFRLECSRCGRMRTFVVGFLLAVLLFTEQCEALSLRDERYNRILRVCEDKLELWRNSSSAAAESLPPAPSGRRNESLSSRGIFMRGKWKLGPPDSGPVTHPAFLSGSEGTFDFFSTRVASGSPDSNVIAIQNISAQMYLRDDGESKSRPALFRATGLYNRQAGELCLVVCSRVPSLPSNRTLNATNATDSANGTAAAPGVYNPSFNEENDQRCGIRGHMILAGGKKFKRMSVEGGLESLSNVSESGYFTSISLKGSVVNNADQQALFHVDIIVRSIIFVIEAGIVIWQLVHSIRSPSGYFVSMLMILVQIVVMCVLAVRLIYLPLRLLSYRNFKYLISSLTLLPYFIATGIIVLNFFFFLVIFRKRRVAKRLNVEDRPKEVVLSVVCITIYSLVGVVLWSLKNFETYLQVVWCWFLLPQVIANVFWDLRTKPLHWFYVTGVTFCRIAYLGFNALRPTIYGYDDLDEYPQGWFWGTTGTMLIFASYALVQQRYGGRMFLPQRWFGYQQLPASHDQATQEQSFTKGDDDMFDL